MTNLVRHTNRNFKFAALVSAIAIYALVMQPLLMIAGSQLAQAAALDDLSLFELCLHNPDGSPVAPSDQQRHPVHQHCVQCFSGAFVLLDAPQTVTLAPVNQQLSKFRHAGLWLRPTSPFLYSVASPRGPPLSA
jgi:hypothetical protein